MHTYWNPDNARDAIVFVALSLTKKAKFSSYSLSYFIIVAPTTRYHHRKVPEGSVVGLVHVEVG